MPAKPTPGLVDVVVDHQSFVVVLIYDPGRGRHVGQRVFPGENIRLALEAMKDQRLILAFLLVEGDERCNCLVDFHGLNYRPFSMEKKTRGKTWPTLILLWFGREER